MISTIRRDFEALTVVASAAAARAAAAGAAERKLGLREVRLRGVISGSLVDVGYLQKCELWM